MNERLPQLGFQSTEGFAMGASRVQKTSHPVSSNPFALQLINKEEELLEKEKSTFPLLQALISNKVPYEQLWLTTYEFSIKSEEWMNGTVRSGSVYWDMVAVLF